MPKTPLRSYKDLITWQRAMNLVDAALALSQALRRFRRGLASRLERAAISVPANIAEGYGRSSRKEYLRFLSIASASLREVETFGRIAQRNRLASSELIDPVLRYSDETGRLLHGLAKSLQPRREP